LLSHRKGILFADLASGLKVRGIDFDDHTGDETADELFRELTYHFWVGIRGEDKLFPCQIYCIESMQEFFLRSRLAGQEVDIVDSQQIRLSDTTPESLQLFSLQGQHELIGEIFR